MKLRDVVISITVGGLVIGGTYVYLRGGGQTSTLQTSTAEPASRDASRLQPLREVAPSGAPNLKARNTPPVELSTDQSASIGGIDSAGTGVRDDVSKYIENHYQDPAQRAAMMRYAASQRNFIVNGGTRERAVAEMTSVFKSLDCISKSIGRGGMDDSQVILSMMLNTKERWQAYSVAMKNMSGHIYMETPGDPCKN
ncbi:hypothetical protein PFF91_28775 [Burkholderia cenocepacia]|uniref:hypothetical protein n=1 Tax=Burkholderia cenocepacia TaxID=95486 RepID=UPI0022EB8132|nr:hypothetical protein [Burkholderia cenocepacia]MDA3669996.1 hypothetical protein [Burkholderia cenocepacia]MDA3679750.1 hypothetical protein [Burkholderia cenocepacia]MDA3687587.1 hypothetical protein [Burkholderia cenocepacia]MDA3695010.1 hypothetical protein [Burkholderia cenocepacia]MDA3701935.1 hypothetical protein [Burkholderia cenocepacia]